MRGCFADKANRPISIGRCSVGLRSRSQLCVFAFDRRPIQRPVCRLHFGAGDSARGKPAVVVVGQSTPLAAGGGGRRARAGNSRDSNSWRETADEEGRRGDGQEVCGDAGKNRTSSLRYGKFVTATDIAI